jgi:hypothetical protein
MTTLLFPDVNATREIVIDIQQVLAGSGTIHAQKHEKVAAERNSAAGVAARSARDQNP